MTQRYTVAAPRNASHSAFDSATARPREIVMHAPSSRLLNSPLPPKNTKKRKTKKKKQQHQIPHPYQPTICSIPLAVKTAKRSAAAFGSLNQAARLTLPHSLGITVIGIACLLYISHRVSKLKMNAIIARDLLATFQQQPHLGD